MITIFHNPRCSKSRQTLELLQAKGEEIEIVEYLKEGELTPERLDRALSALGIKAREALRTKEKEFKELELDVDDEKAVKKAILSCPKILERPIVMRKSKAVFGRPPENIKNLFS